MPYKDKSKRREHYQKIKNKYNKSKRERRKNDEQYKNKINAQSKKYYYDNRSEILEHRKKLRQRPDAKEKVKEQNKKWLEKNREKNKDDCKKRYYKNHAERLKYRSEYRKKYSDAVSDSYRKWREKNIDTVKENYRKWRKSPNGRYHHLKNNHKRKEKLKFNKLFENEIINEPISWHHIDDKNMVAIPEEIHKLYNYGRNNKRHRENLMPIVEQIYPEIKKKFMKVEYPPSNSSSRD